MNYINKKNLCLIIIVIFTSCVNTKSGLSHQDKSTKFRVKSKRNFGPEESFLVWAEKVNRNIENWSNTDMIVLMDFDTDTSGIIRRIFDNDISYDSTRDISNYFFNPKEIGDSYEYFYEKNDTTVFFLSFNSYKTKDFLLRACKKDSNQTQLKKYVNSIDTSSNYYKENKGSVIHFYFRNGRVLFLSNR